jgi:predicted nucleotidyltransferase
MSGLEMLRLKRRQILDIAVRHGATQVRVFGSVARGDDRPESDIDLLVRAGPKTSPWFPGGLVFDLEKLLGRPVQVVTEGGLDELLRDRVLDEAVPL